MKSVADIIVRPLITEKSMDGVAEKRYSFEVAKDATKAEIAHAVETMFKKTKVVKVNTINMKKKPKRYGVHFGYTSEWKKAIVTLSEDEEYDEEIAEYMQRIADADLPSEVREKLVKETIKLSKQPYSSHESAVLRGYIDTCLELPWNTYTTENIDLQKVRKELDKKGCDYLVANDISRKDIGFSSDMNEVYILDKNLKISHIERDTKLNIAKKILEKIFE